jgi:glutathione synthase/RimK-type ligase-like ATP-grasp enzyme
MPDVRRGNARRKARQPHRRHETGMKRVCFLSMDDLTGYIADDDLAIKPLAELGWQVETISWRDASADWNDFDAVVIRTTWDYQRDPENFLKVLETIDSSSAQLENPLEIVRWNVSKRYLKEMGERGCPIVRTIWDTSYSEGQFAAWQEELSSKELIVKPLISGTAEHTYRLAAYDPKLETIFEQRSFLVQPFIPAIVSEGEYSLFYFGGEFGHAINKSPKPADFRVQEEHGGIITAIEPEESLLNAGRRAIDLIGQELLYARVDLVRHHGEFLLMELELIEPALYLRMHPRAPRFFAEQFDRRMNEL